MPRFMRGIFFQNIFSFLYMYIFNTVKDTKHLLPYKKFEGTRLD